MATSLYGDDWKKWPEDLINPNKNTLKKFFKKRTKKNTLINYLFNFYLQNN
ncbi:MAG: hypothetical protein CM1200mP13_08610 [Candidatus Pelagibacterales bacterium]|nr:MAG: hypothetical protein CM1200mP13_08610 [Pelagibacterales bacterium]